MPVLHQPFVVGPGFLLIPAKIVKQIILGKFVEFNEVLSNKIKLTDPEPQLLFDGCLVLTWALKKSKCCIEDSAMWIEAFSTFMLVLSSYFPHRLEGPLPVPTADLSNSLSVPQSCVAFL